MRTAAFTILARGLVLLIVALLAGAHATSSRAASLDAALARFAADSFSETDTAIGEIVVSGAPTALPVLEALSQARLLIDPASKSVYYRSAGGEVFDARNGAIVKLQADIKLEPVRVNNRLRRTIEAALGSLTLLSPEPAKRRQAADSIFRSKDAASLPALEAALAKEQDAGVRKAFAAARAVVILNKADAAFSDKLEAIEALRQRGDQDAIGVLRGAAATLGDDNLKRAAADATAGIESRLAIVAQVQNIYYGLSLGSVLLLAAIGLAITFGVMGVINMAHGEMVMLGAYTTYVVQEVFRSTAPDYFGWSLPIAIPLAFLVTALVGIAIERGIIRFLYGRPLETLLATWGVSLFLQQAVRTAFGPTNKEVGAPSYMSGSFDVFSLQITYGRLWIIVFTLVVFVALLLVLKATPLGLQMRAVTQNRRMASAMGIRTPWVDAMTFGLGSGVAGIAGVALSQIDNVSPNLGQSYIIDSFMVVVFGGVGNLWGTLVSAFALGIANKFLEPLAGAVLAKIVILVLLILFIQKRPRGLFALKGRGVEA